jgi:uncharacterized protein YecA (UPF0149 family)
MFEHLLNGTGPFDPEAVDALQPEPELLAFLREQLTLPWPEFEEPDREAENDVPFYSMLMLGLLRDEESIGPIIDVVTHAVENDWDAVAEIGPPVLGAIGAASLPPVLAELERIEREEMIDSMEIERKGLDESKVYRYWSLVIAVEQITLNHPEVAPAVVRFALERLRSTKYDRPKPTSARVRKALENAELPTITELWVDLQISLRLPELDEAITEFFDRHGPQYTSHIFGGRGEYEELMAGEAPEGDARQRILDLYAELQSEEIEEVEEDDDDDDEESHPPYVRPEPKVGRNDPCPCGSGRKYKKCHGV